MVRLPLGVSRCGNTPNLAPAGDTVAVRRRSAVDAQAHRTLGLTLVLLLAQGVPLVVLLLAAGEGDEDLGTPPDEVQLQRDDRVTLLPALAGELVDLGPVEEELALAAHRVVRPGALAVLGDVDALQPRLAAVDLHPPVDEGRTAHAQRLDLGAGEDDARLVGLVDVVVVPGLRVAGDHAALVGLRLGLLGRGGLAWLGRGHRGLLRGHARRRWARGCWDWVREWCDVPA